MSSEPSAPESPSAAGILFVVSAPSGTGKTSAVEQLVQRVPGLAMSRSYTSRAPRAGEIHGVDYNFVSREEFQALVARDELLEWADVFGNFYGTRRIDTELRLATGCDLVMVIDVQGARQVRGRLPSSVGVFVLPPSFATLEARLRGRSQDEPPAIVRRLATARDEVSAVVEYDYVVVNHTLDQCVDELFAIVVAERLRFERRRAVVAPIVDTFRNRASGPEST